MSRWQTCSERGTEAPAEEVDVVVERLGGGVKGLVRHNAGAGEIAGQVDDEEAARLPLKARLVRDAVEELVPAEQP